MAMTTPRMTGKYALGTQVRTLKNTISFDGDQRIL